jgi:hypothetical protein
MKVNSIVPFKVSAESCPFKNSPLMSRRLSSNSAKNSFDRVKLKIPTLLVQNPRGGCSAPHGQPDDNELALRIGKYRGHCLRKYLQTSEYVRCGRGIATASHNSL